MRRSYSYAIITLAIVSALSGYVVVSGIGIGNSPNATGGTSLPVAGGILNTANSLWGKQSGNDNSSDSLDISPNSNIIAADGNNDADQSNLSPSVNFLGNSGVTTSEDIQVDNSGSNSNTHYGTSSSDGGCTDTTHECFEFVVPESLPEWLLWWVHHWRYWADLPISDKQRAKQVSDRQFNVTNRYPDGWNMK